MLEKYAIYLMSFFFLCFWVCIYVSAILTVNFFIFYLFFSPQVTYDTSGFLEKNRDLLHLDSIQLLSSCTSKLPQIFASSMLSQSEKPAAGSLNKSGGVDSQKLSVMLKFKVHSLPALFKTKFFVFVLFNMSTGSICFQK